MSEYVNVGDSITLPAAFTVAGVATDPTALTLVVTDPTGSAVTYHWPSPAEITHDSTGQFHAVVTATTAGAWAYVWTGTGAAAGVQSGTFTVYPVDPNVNQYCTPAELKDVLQIADTTDDAYVAVAINSASRWIDTYCRRKFWLDPVATVNTFIPQNLYFLSLADGGYVNDIGSPTVTIKSDTSGDGVFEITWQTADYLLMPVNAPNAIPEPGPYTDVKAVGAQFFPISFYPMRARADRIQITARYGWPAVPDTIHQACLIQAGRIYKRRFSLEGVQGAGDFGIVRVSKNIDPDVEMMIEPYRWHPILAR